MLIAVNFKSIVCRGLLTIMAGCALANAAWAAGTRNFPGNSLQVYISEVGNGAIMADGVALKLASGVVVYNEANRSIVRSRIPAGIKARLLLNDKNEVQRMWILTTDEIEADPKNTLGSRQRERANANVLPQ